MNKESQYIYSDPKKVAEEIASVVLVMISKMSLESQTKAKMNIKNRINKIQPMELNLKKNNGGAAIGTSISLIKNILNGKDIYFIKSVIDELTKIL